MSLISIYKGVSDTTSNEVVSLNAIFAAIKNGKYKDRIEHIRDLYSNNGSKQTIQNLKKPLPCVTFSGTFSERLDDKLIDYSHFIVIDIDDISNKRLVKLKKELTENPYIYAYFDGVTKGIKVLVYLSSPYKYHRDYAFYQVEEMFNNVYNVKVDPSGKNISRLCFLSYDPNIYINDDPTTFPVDLSRKKPEYDPKQFKTIVKPENICFDAYKIFDTCLSMMKKSKTGAYRIGNRNNYVFVLSCLLFEFGVNYDMVVSLIIQRYQSLSFKEVTTTVKSAEKKVGTSFGVRVLVSKKNNNGLF